MKIDGRRTAEDEPTLNLTPMIDVVFQLLIFFMVATTFLDPEKEIEIELPEAVSGAPSDDVDEIIINIMEDGSIVLSGETVDDESLLARLKAAAQANPDLPVTIRADRLARHGRTVLVMDACSQAGLANLAVGTLEGI